MSSERDRPAAGSGEAELVRALRERGDQVPADVAERLVRMRRSAVAELERREALPGRRPLWPWLGGLAAAALALSVALLLSGPAAPEPDALLLADADELAAIAELDVLEDLEFLAWLEQEQLDAGQG